MQRSILFLVLGLALGLVIVGAVVLLRPYTPSGSLIEPPVPAPDFTLPSTQGDFRLADQRGKMVLIFFGYTTCPDVCPATLGEMKTVHRLGNAADNVRFVFITVDPERDSVERAGQYAGNFHPAFFGLSGSEEQLAPVWKGYGVYREKRVQEGSAAGYLMDHSSQVYMINADGNLRMTFAFGTPVDDIYRDVKHYLMK